MSGAILKATNSSFQKGLTFCRSIYVKKVMKLLAFIFEQPSYITCVLILSSDVSTRVSSSEAYTLVFYLAIVNTVLRHCHSWLARQYM